jgi:ferric iron reductase protein FhuF
MPLSVAGPYGGRQRPAPGTGPRWAGPGGACDRLVGDVIAPLTAAVARLAPVSPRVLWGNVASAGNSAAAQIAVQRPDLAPAAWAAARALASHPRLSTERTPPGPAFRRSSCCLIYQLTPGPAHAICKDCVLARP